MVKQFTTIGKEEEEAVLRVLHRNQLSGYVAGKDTSGVEVSRLETNWAEFFGVNYAIACNSATSGLLAACMAIGVGHGDEVIVPFLTMSATACAPNVLGAQIVLADVDENLCIDVNHVGKLINENTKAVIATNLFGHPAKLAQLRAMCDSVNAFLIEDNAQAIGAKEGNRYTGTIGHIGVFSLNYHKQIQAGEGGICVTDNYALNIKLRGAINHGEHMSLDFPGLNLRMTEITAAIAIEQLKKLPDILKAKEEVARAIIGHMREYAYASPLPTRDNCTNTYYAIPFLTRFEYDVGSIADLLARSTQLNFSAGYSNLMRLKLGCKWIWDDCHAYRDVGGLILLEMYSDDITMDSLKHMEKIFA